MTQDQSFDEQHANVVEWMQALSAVLRVKVSLVDGPALLALSELAGKSIAPGAAPVTMFLIGLAAARGEDAAATLEAVAKATALVRAWPSDHSEADMLGEWLD